MTCPTCKHESSHIRIDSRGVGCHDCRGFSESGGSLTDKVLTRNSDRVLEQQVQFEGDMQTPYVVDKSTNQVIVNEEFINLYPEQAAQTYTAEELKSVGQPDLKPSQQEYDKTGVEFSGSEEQAVTEIMNEV